jgi:thiamine biosynthesis lipoprotein
MRHLPPQNLSTGNISSSTRRLRVALGTWVAVEVQMQVASSAGGAGSAAQTRADEVAAIEAAYAAIRDIDIRMHPRRDGSEIARINSTPPGMPVEVQPDTWRLLQLARRLYDLTGGIFDPCIPTRPGRLGDIEIQPNTPTLICHAPVEIDLGGIAKGHAIDAAVEKLQELGCAAGLINAGGDLRVFGDRAETIFLRRGAQDSSTDDNATDVGKPPFYPLVLQNAALAVSDLDAADRPSEHQGYYVRGCEREPDDTHPRYAAVIASSAAVADGLTKCVLLCPNDLATRVLHKLSANVVP